MGLHKYFPKVCHCFGTDNVSCKAVLMLPLTVDDNNMHMSADYSWVLFLRGMLYKVLPSSDPSGGEEEQDDGADRGSAAVGNPCRGHQPLHGHLQEDELRLLRPLRLFLQLHHVS